MGEPLDSTPVYRNLTFTSAWFGLTPLDLPLMLVPGGAVVLVCMLVGVSTIWGSIASVAIGAALIALKWRRPDDYVETLLHTALAPRRLSHKERDTVVLPFPLDAALRERAPTSQDLRSTRKGNGDADGAARSTGVERRSTIEERRSTADGARARASRSDAARTCAEHGTVLRECPVESAATSTPGTAPARVST